MQKKFLISNTCFLVFEKTFDDQNFGNLKPIFGNQELFLNFTIATLTVCMTMKKKKKNQAHQSFN